MTRVVIAGTAQRTWRPGEGEVPSPDVMMAEVAAEAAGSLLEHVSCLAIVDCFSWPVADPGSIVAEHLGTKRAQGSFRSMQRIVSSRGGSGPIALLEDVSRQIADGELDAAIVVGAEAVTPFMKAMRAGEELGWPQTPEGAAPDRVVGVEHEANHPGEAEAGLIAPIFFYPLFEHALRAADGEDEATHMARVAPWWARFSQVAADNPLAWSRESYDAEQVAAPAPDNRLVSSPYVKRMNANIQVDQAAAILVCREDLAPAPLAWVRATATASDHWHVGERDVLHRSPAIAACGRAVLGAVDAEIGDVQHLDLYSCFPSAVQIGAREYGVDLDTRTEPVTVTGGLPFFGGPANNYVTHSLATVAERLGAGGDPDALGLATAVSWYLTKHGAAVLSAGPGEFSTAGDGPQSEVDALPRREIAEAFEGEAPIETYTALYDRDGTATMGIVACLLPDGRRAFAKTHDLPTIEELLGSDPLGRTVRHDGQAGFSF